MTRYVRWVCMCVFVCTCIDIWRELDGHIPCYEQGIYLIFEITGGMVFVLHFSPWPYCWFCNETQFSIFFFLRSLSCGNMVGDHILKNRVKENLNQTSKRNFLSLFSCTPVTYIQLPNWLFYLGCLKDISNFSNM